MTQGLLQQLLPLIAQTGSDKHDSDEVRLQKTLLVLGSMSLLQRVHAQALVRMALEMRDFIAAHVFINGQQVSFRIGINSGPVIGKRKFVYDVWGDAVNIASRMESHGAGGTIQIAQATYELIKDEFACEPRGTVNIKGKGEMEVWRVISAK